MSEKTGIEWTEATWNPTTGCDRCSPGCANCYAKAIHDRRHKAHLAGKVMPVQFHQPFEVVQTRDDRLEAPLHWRRPRRIFVDSMSDLFYGDEDDRHRCERRGLLFHPVPDEFIDRVFAVMALCPQHVFQVLTKRPARMRIYLNSRTSLTMGALAAPTREIYQSAYDVTEHVNAGREIADGPWPLPNIRLGPSIENQHFADERFPIVCDLGEAGWHTMVSLEPLLGPVVIPDRYLALGARAWVIPGGESGGGARPCRLRWIRDLVQQCRATGVAVFVKQIGSRPSAAEGPPAELHDVLLHVLFKKNRKGGDPAEWPEDLRVREFPRPMFNEARP